jgi:hypothetical protein
MAAGCHTVSVGPSFPSSPIPEKVPLRVGLYISDALAKFEASRPIDPRVSNVGQASATAFRWALEAVFQTVETVTERPPLSHATSLPLHLVVEPAIEAFDVEFPFLEYRASITYHLTVRDMTGMVL